MRRGASRSPQVKAPSQGARRRRLGAGHKLGAWWAHHGASARDSLVRLAAEPLKSLLTALLLGIALALPALLYLGLANVQQLAGRWQSAQQLSLYLQPGATAEAAEQLRARLAAGPDWAQTTLVSPDQGLAQLAEHSDFGDLAAQLDHNPLPYALLLTPADAEPAQLARLRDALAAEPLVASVQLDMAWLARLATFMALGQRLALGLGALLGLGMLLAIGNTLRLAIENRRDEILIVKLVGGTDAFVRRPFLYTGLWYGLAGGLGAWLLVSLGLWLLAEPVHGLAASYQSDFALRGLGLAESLALLGSGAAIGWLGAWLAVGRHLRDIQPS